MNIALKQSLKDSAQRFMEFWNDFRKEKSGLVGLGILVIALIVVIFEPLFLPFKDVNKNWRNITYWEDNPAAAPPVWTNWFSRQKSATSSRVFDPVISEESDPDYGEVVVYAFDYKYKFDKAPLDLILRATANGRMLMNVYIERPDGETISLGRVFKEGLEDDPIRFSVDTDARSMVYEFARDYASSSSISRMGRASIRSTNVIFCETGPKMLEERLPLKGDYKYIVKIPKQILADANNYIVSPRLYITGRVSGLLGTDTLKRDIFSGIIAGLKWAMFIGFITSVIAVFIGVIYGIVSAYFAGVTDTIMSFIFELFVSIPILPILIVMSAIFKPNIWIIIAILVIFSWVGPVKTVRSMALQIKEETYIEAAKALGSGKWRVIFKHMAPLLLPYSFADMALSVPGFIVFEASLSLMGLGDPTIVTWGQILHEAQSSGATLNGLWWWIIPPGLFIAIMGMTFAFLGFAMDKILNPKLRTR